MKKIPNRTTEILADAEGKRHLQYADLLLAVINTPPSGGFTPSILRQRIRIADVLESVRGTAAEIALEDADFDTMKQALAGFGWRILHKDVLALLGEFSL
jgi:hypothetical protein